jgi:hypothetical protein
MLAQAAPHTVRLLGRERGTVATTAGGTRSNAVLAGPDLDVQVHLELSQPPYPVTLSCIWPMSGV